MDKLGKLLRTVRELRLPVEESALEQLFTNTPIYVVLAPDDKIFLTASPQESDIVVAKQVWKQYVRLVEND